MSFQSLQSGIFKKPEPHQKSHFIIYFFNMGLPSLVFVSMSVFFHFKDNIYNFKSTRSQIHPLKSTVLIGAINSNVLV